jgi:hypothetical protein
MAADPFADITQLESQLGLPKGFYDNDWSFVIKLNALFEAAATHILVVRLQVPELEGALANLDFAHGKYGKVVLLRKLDAINKDQATLLRMLAELRNSLVHDISSISFSFSDYVGSRDEHQRENLIAAFGRGIVDPVPIAEKNIPRREFVISNPKIALWLTSAEVLACLYLEREMSDLRNRRFAFDVLAKLDVFSPKQSEPLK